MFRQRVVVSVFFLGLLGSTMGGCPGLTGGSSYPEFTGYFADGVTTVESRDSAGKLLTVDSPAPAISADGRFVAFEVDPGIGIQIHVRDRATGITELVSKASDGIPFESLSWEPSLSGDGRMVAFESFGETLAHGDDYDNLNIFVHDRQTGATVRVTTGTNVNGYSRSPALSQDGRFVAFVSSANNLVPDDTNGRYDVFLHDLQTQATIRVNVSSTGQQDGGGANDRNSPGISADGRFVAFESDGENLVPDDTNGEEDVFVHDRLTLATVRVSVSSSGEQGTPGMGGSRSPAISADGRLVAFISWDKNLAPGNEYSEASGSVAYVHDRDADGNGVYDETCDGCRRTERVPLEAPDFPDDGSVDDLAISGDGSTIAYCRTLTTTDDPRAPYTYDSTVWIYNRATGASRRVTADVPGVRIAGDSLYWVPISRQSVNDSQRPQLSHDGRFVTYWGELNATYPNAPETVIVEDLRP